MRRHSSSMSLVASIVAAGLAAAACGSSGTTSAGGATTTQPPASQPPATAPGTSVAVKLTEFAIQLPQQTLPPGTYTFVASNDGQTTHALEIIGPGRLDERTDTVSSGHTANLTVTLQPGNYELSCPVDDHKQEGMDTRITISPASPPITSFPPPTGGGD